MVLRKRNARPSAAPSIPVTLARDALCDCDVRTSSASQRGVVSRLTLLSAHEGHTDFARLVSNFAQVAKIVLHHVCRALSAGRLSV